MEPLKPQMSDSLFIGCANRTLLQYSTRQRKLTKAHLEITPYEISALRTTADKKHLFIGDKCGNLKQIFLQTHGVTHDFGQLDHGSICSLATTPDNQYLFVVCGAGLKQFLIASHECVNTYVLSHEIFSVVTSSDGKHVFAGLYEKSLHQICIDSRSVTKEIYLSDDITAMAVTRDNKY
jgi:hypothetical protein